MERSEKIELALLLEEKERRARERKLFSYYPDEGPLRRELYVKHLSFFAAGANFIERLMMAANRVGKTEGVGAYETALHLTGLYPAWWVGRRFDRPIDAWAAGDTSETVRDIIQLKLFGNLAKGEIGTGLIPKEQIVDYSRKRGVADTVDSIFVRHVSGGVSQISLKSYDQGRLSFQGTKKDLVWLDEEPPLDIYTECLLRTTDTSGGEDANGMMVLTFTPLSGLSETVMQFLPAGRIEEQSTGTKFVVFATWDDAPHLSQATKDALWNAMPPFQREARSKGVPTLGAGAIYPIPESDFVVSDFEIPAHWPRAYAMDVGWNRTAAIWGAIDRESDTVYLYSEHYRGEAEPAVHAQAVNGRGEWIKGAIDPAARGRSQVDGQRLIQMYIDLGLHLEFAKNGVESGIEEVRQRLSSGRLKVFKSMSNWLFEFRIYRRDTKGRVVKEHDHAMDATRYLIMSGLDLAKTKPAKKNPNSAGSSATGGWMG